MEATAEKVEVAAKIPQVAPSAEAIAAAAAAKEEEDKLNQLLVLAASEGKDEEVESLLKSKADPSFQDDNGTSVMMMAAAKGYQHVISALLQAGAPWNALDKQGDSVGEYAARGGHMDTFERLIDAGCRAEMLLSLLIKPEANDDYLQQKLKFVGDTILDANDDAVMMGWEHPLMKLHADLICDQGGDVLNIGFGLGLIDMEIQQRQYKTHTIIEAHPDIYAHMLEKGWDRKPGVRVVFGRWQDVLPSLGPFDGIFFDTYGEHYEHMKELHKELPRMLKPGGVYSFFNGLAASTNGFFHTVYCRVVELELLRLNLSTLYVQKNMNDINAAEEWTGVRRKYWVLDTYNLPIVKHIEAFNDEDARHQACAGFEAVCTACQQTNDKHPFQPTPPACPKAHELQAFSTPEEGWCCGACFELMPAASTMHGCRVCDWDACEACMTPKPACTTFVPGTVCVCGRTADEHAEAASAAKKQKLLEAAPEEAREAAEA